MALNTYHGLANQNSEYAFNAQELAVQQRTCWQKQASKERYSGNDLRAAHKGSADFSEEAASHFEHLVGHHSKAADLHKQISRLLDDLGEVYRDIAAENQRLGDLVMEHESNRAAERLASEVASAQS